MEVSEKPLSRNGRRLLSSGKRRMKASDLTQMAFFEVFLSDLLLNF